MAEIIANPERPAMERVMRWRRNGHWVRLGQNLAVTPLAWLATHSMLVPAWFLATLALIGIEAGFLRLSADRMDPDVRRRWSLAFLGLSTACFASLGLILLPQHSPVTLACAGILFCGCTLNNAVMTRGWPAATWTAVASPALMMLAAAPLAAMLLGLRFGASGGLVLEAAAVGYMIFIGRLAATLTREEAALREKRRQAEEAQASAEQALGKLRESEARYRMLTDRTRDFIIRYNVHGVIEFASPSVRRVGYEPEALIGRNMAEFTHPDDAADALTVRCDVTGGRSFPLDSRHDVRTRMPNGDYIWLQGSPSPIHDDAGQIIGAVTVLRDISAQRAMEEELRGKQAEAEAAVRAKSDFLANMTHELRTPLNAIVGFSGILKNSDALIERDARQVEFIWDASQTLLHVVNDVLDFSKLEAGAVELELHAFNPRQVAESAVSLLSGQAALKGLSLSVIGDGVERPLLGDSARLRQVLLNFISNGIKFTANGGVQVRVSQCADGDRWRLRVEVADSGIGVPEAQIDSIFGRFTQADASVSRQYGGTGLGLAISKRIIEAMDGEIGVFSPPGGGSTFWFEAPMPLADAPVVDDEPVDAPSAVEENLRLLVVEDNAVNRELICTLLSPFDLVIETASDGVEAVEAVSRAEFDLILMDVQMPNMDGLTATRRIRAMTPPGGRRVPIIAMTANVLPDQVERCRGAGMDDHLGKPINPSKLLEALARWSGPEEAEGTGEGGPREIASPGCA